MGTRVILQGQSQCGVKGMRQGRKILPTHSKLTIVKTNM